MIGDTTVMLDGFIIERIRRERERQQERDGGFQPLRIERGPPLPGGADEERERERDRRRDDRGPDRGSAVIDFTL